MARDLANAGIDFIKDDELIANPPYSPLAKRVDAVMAVLRRHADATGKRVMFAFNITDAAGEMQRHHDLVVAAGGSCLMIGLNNVGLSATQHLRGYSQLPIHGHRNGWGMLSRHPLLGLDFSPYQKIWRCAGVDQIHVNGLGNKFAESDESVIRSIKACLRPLHASPPAMPVISSGQWGGQAPATYDACSTTDLMYLAGGGILAHPGGMAAGVAAIRQAWEAAVLGIGLADYAEEHRQLAQSIAKFGPVP
jgi:ribulose-bisphosphate carboxylase large chain